MEKKLKKATTERAPGRSLLDGLVDLGRATGNPFVDQLLRGQGRSSTFGLADPQAPAAHGSGAAAAAGVLTAVDEDVEGDEAQVPEEFDYFSDTQDE